MSETKNQLLLRRAADLVGRGELAIRLKVPGSLLEAWISGHVAMPDRQLIVLADILNKFADRSR